jgi:hypothetical protein
MVRCAESKHSRGWKHSDTNASLGSKTKLRLGPDNLSTMELLLNLLWLMLVLPTVLLYRHTWKLKGNEGPVGRSQDLVLTACLLAVVFPVVSVSDNLHALSAEVEYSGLGKRMLKQGAAKVPHWHVGKLPARTVSVSSFRPDGQLCGLILDYPPFLPEQATSRSVACRAPPVSKVLASIAPWNYGAKSCVQDGLHGASPGSDHCGFAVVAVAHERGSNGLGSFKCKIAILTPNAGVPRIRRNSIGIPRHPPGAPAYESLGREGSSQASLWFACGEILSASYGIGHDVSEWLCQA